MRCSVKDPTKFPRRTKKKKRGGGGGGEEGVLSTKMLVWHRWLFPQKQGLGHHLT